MPGWRQFRPRRRHAVRRWRRGQRASIQRRIDLAGALPGAGGHHILIAVQAFHQEIHRVPDTVELLALEHAALRVIGGELQALERHLVIIGRERTVLQKQLRMILGLVRVARQDALVKALHRRQGGPVAQHHVEEFQLLGVAAQHDEAERQRRR